MWLVRKPQPTTFGRDVFVCSYEWLEYTILLLYSSILVQYIWSLRGDELRFVYDHGKNEKTHILNVIFQSIQRTTFLPHKATCAKASTFCEAAMFGYLRWNCVEFWFRYIHSDWLIYYSM